MVHFMRALFAAFFAQSHGMPMRLRHQPAETESEGTSPDSEARLPANESQQLMKTTAKSQACTPANTIFDIGFYDGSDSRTYLTSGYCVVGVEADPDLVIAANKHFPAQIASGQLRMMNVVVAPEGDPAGWSIFYKSHCSKEWNSFYETIGCRTCSPPHSLNHTMCTPVKVTATDCSSIFASLGTPFYLKLDIEGAESGCFQAMGKFAGQALPHLVSAEIAELEYVDTLHSLGYKGFKLVRQDHHNTVSATSGPWGDQAMDCKTGNVWRTYSDTRAEFSAILSKPHDPAEPCSGGVMRITGETKAASSYTWYDIHATLTPPAPR